MDEMLVQLLKETRVPIPAEPWEATRNRKLPGRVDGLLDCGLWARRLIEFTIDAPSCSEQYRLLCSISDYRESASHSTRAPLPERWTIETVFAELKTTLPGNALVLRGKTPAHIRQEIYGILMAHFGVRAFMLEAALSEKIDPTDFSLLHALRVVSRYLPLYVPFPLDPSRGSTGTRSRRAAPALPSSISPSLVASSGGIVEVNHSFALAATNFDWIG